jgi:hypothetical protein
MPQRTIVVGYDGDHTPYGALALGFALGRPESKLLLALAYSADKLSRDDAEQLLRLSLRQLPYGQPAGLRAVENTAPSDALAQVAWDEAAHLVVLGKNPSGGMTERLAASVACPIVVAPARAA